MCSLRRLLSLVLAVIMSLSLLPAAALAADVSSLTLKSKMNWGDADNFGAYDYSTSKPKTGYSMGFYTIDNGDGTVSGLVVPPAYQKYDRATGTFYYVRPDNFYVEKYDAQGNVVSSKTLPMELPLFGAFLAGKNYNYMAFGQSNPNGSSDLEVWRIVQYDKDWNRLASVSVTGGATMTKEPFRSTVARMAESHDGKTLTLLSARSRTDGHQSNVTIQVNTQPFQIKQVLGDEFPQNHVSHSFGQFIQYDGSKLVTVDHGDAYPRAFVLQDFNGNEVNLLNIAGETKDNVTNAIGSGFEVSGSGYLFLGCSDPQQGGTSQPWNVFLAYVGKDMKQVKLTWLTGGSESITCARLVKVDDNTFVAMWGESDGTHWQQLDGSGKKVGDENVLKGIPMPPTQPIVQGKSIRWIQEKSGTPCLFTLNLGGAQIMTPPPSNAEAPSSWAAEFVDAAKKAGILPANLQSKYTQATTRAEYCALATALYESLRGEITQRQTFCDTTDPNVEKMAALGVVNGTGEGKFSPGNNLTREQAATMLSRLAAALGCPFGQAAPDFTDNTLVSSWAFDAVGQVQSSGIMNGVGGGRFSPKGSYTREQSIITMVRMMEMANE